MTFHWLLTVAALSLLAAVALVRARRAAKRLERLTESYWELRYEHGQLRARARRGSSRRRPREPAATPAARRPAATTFVPLSSLKR